MIVSLWVLLLSQAPSTTASERHAGATGLDPVSIALSNTLAAEFQKGGDFETTSLERTESVGALSYLALNSKALPLAQRAYKTIASKLGTIVADGRDPRSAHPLALEAVLVGLGRPERPILHDSLRAAAYLNQGTEAHEPSLRAMADLALKHRDPDVRYAALSRLWEVSIPVFIRSSLIPDAMAQALDDGNEGVVAQDIAMLNLIGPRIPALAEPLRRQRLLASLGRLRSHGSSALRAAAIGATAHLYYPGIELPEMPAKEPGADARAFATELMRTLEDPSPPVRGMAASAVGLLRFVDVGVPRLGIMLNDPANLAVSISGLRSLDTDEAIELPIRIVDIGEPQTVAMAALRALMFKSLYRESNPKLRITCDSPGKTFADCVARARDWALRVTRAGAPPSVAEDVKEPKRLKYVAPVYDDIAKQAGVQGDVILELEISPQGTVTNVKIVRNIPLLGSAAAAAARQWVYEPTLQDGTPVSRTLTVTEPFALPASARRKP